MMFCVADESGPSYREGYGVMLISRWSAYTTGDRYLLYPARVTRFIDCSKPNGTHKFCVEVHSSRTYVGVMEISEIPQYGFARPLTDEDEICDFSGAFQSPPRPNREMEDDIMTQEKPYWHNYVMKILFKRSVLWYGYNRLQYFEKQLPIDEEFDSGDRIGIVIDTEKLVIQFYHNGGHKVFEKELPSGRYVPVIAAACGEYAEDPSIGANIVPFSFEPHTRSEYLYGADEDQPDSEEIGEESQLDDEEIGEEISNSWQLDAEEIGEGVSNTWQ